MASGAGPGHRPADQPPAVARRCRARSTASAHAASSRAAWSSGRSTRRPSGSCTTSGVPCRRTSTKRCVSDRSGQKVEVHRPGRFAQGARPRLVQDEALATVRPGRERQLPNRRGRRRGHSRAPGRGAGRGRPRWFPACRAGRRRGRTTRPIPVAAEPPTHTTQVRVGLAELRQQRPPSRRTGTGQGSWRHSPLESRRGWVRRPSLFSGGLAMSSRRHWTLIGVLLAPAVVLPLWVPLRPRGPDVPGFPPFYWFPVPPDPPGGGGGHRAGLRLSAGQPSRPGPSRPACQTTDPHGRAVSGPMSTT